MGEGVSLDQAKSIIRLYYAGPVFYAVAFLVAFLSALASVVVIILVAVFFAITATISKQGASPIPGPIVHPKASFSNRTPPHIDRKE